MAASSSIVVMKSISQGRPPLGACQGLAPWACEPGVHPEVSRDSTSYGGLVDEVKSGYSALPRSTPCHGSSTVPLRFGTEPLVKNEVMPRPNMKPGEESRTSSSLLLDLKRGEDMAWERLVERFGASIFRRCRRTGMGVHDAEDVTQEIFASVSRSIENYQPAAGTASFRKWLAVITTNKLRRYWRKHLVLPAATGGSTWCHFIQNLQNEVEGSRSYSRSGSIGGDSTLADVIHLVRAETSGRDWSIFARLAIEGKSPSEVAEELGITPNTVYLVRSRIRRRMKQLLLANAE